MADLRIDGGRYYRLKYDGAVNVTGSDPVQFDGLHSQKLTTAGSVKAKDATVIGSFSADSADADRLHAGTLHVRGSAKLVNSRIEDGGSVAGVLAADGCRLKGTLQVGRGSKLSRCSADEVQVCLGPEPAADGKPDVVLNDTEVLKLVYVGRPGVSRLLRSEVKEEVNSGKRGRGRPRKETAAAVAAPQQSK